MTCKGIWLSVLCTIGLATLLYQAHAGNREETIVEQSFDPQSVVFVTNRNSNDIAVIDMKTHGIVSRIECAGCSSPCGGNGNDGWKEIGDYK